MINEKNPRTLLLTLNKQAFEVMVTGEKNEEFRKPTDWIKSRLYDKEEGKRQYDYIKFKNGYGNNKPYFICKYRGFMHPAFDGEKKTYSNGLTVEVEKSDFIISCGEIVRWGNLDVKTALKVVSVLQQEPNVKKFTVSTDSQGGTISDADGIKFIPSKFQIKTDDGTQRT